MLIFTHVDPDLRYLYIISKVNSTNRWLNLQNLLHTVPQVAGISQKAFLFSKYI